MRKWNIVLALGVLMLIIFIQACAYTIKPTHYYPNASAFWETFNRQFNPINSMKALASVDLNINGKRIEFPEGIIINNKALRLETLNIFYQPVLIVVYNNVVAVLDVGTGTCSISSEDVLSYYTQLHVPPIIFEKLITGQLIGTPLTFSSNDTQLIASGRYEQLSWFTTLNRNLFVQSTIVLRDTDGPVICNYKGYSIIDGAVVPEYVSCSWEKNSLKVHYRKIQINIPVEPSLLDANRLCE